MAAPRISHFQRSCQATLQRRHSAGGPVPPPCTPHPCPPTRVVAGDLAPHSRHRLLQPLRRRHQRLDLRQQRSQHSRRLSLRWLQSLRRGARTPSKEPLAALRGARQEMGAHAAWEHAPPWRCPPTCSIVRRRARCIMSTHVPLSGALRLRVLRPRTTIVPAGRGREGCRSGPENEKETATSTGNLPSPTCLCLLPDARAYATSHQGHHQPLSPASMRATRATPRPYPLAASPMLATSSRWLMPILALRERA